MVEGDENDQNPVHYETENMMLTTMSIMANILLQTMKSFTQYHALLLQSHYNLPVTQQRGYQMFRILQWVWYVHKKSN